MNMLCLLFLLLVSLPLTGQLDTIRTYDSRDLRVVPVRGAQYSSQIYRYDLEKTVKLYGLILYASSEVNSEMTIDIYGNEAGLPRPFVKQNITPSQNINIIPEHNQLEMRLPEPVLLDMDQIFIALSNLSPDIVVDYQLDKSVPHCNSEDGGTYYNSYFEGAGRLKTSMNHMRLDFLVGPADELDLLSFPQFHDVTKQLLKTDSQSAESVSWGRIDDDDKLDFMVEGKLFVANEEGTFDDVSRVSRLPFNYKRMRNLMLDMDNDGLMDIFTSRGGVNFLYRNLGDAKFERIRQSVPRMPHPSVMSLGDLNGDRYLDLFIGQLWKHYPVPLPNLLFLNTRKNNFRNHTRMLYPQHQGHTNFPDRVLCDTLDLETCLYDMNLNSRTRDAQFSDYDSDGDLDLLVVNYFLEEDEFYEQISPGKMIRKDLKEMKKEQASLSLTNPSGGYTNGHANATGYHGTGLEIVDINQDGHADILISQLAHPAYRESLGHMPTTLYFNDGRNKYFHNEKFGPHYEETHSNIAVVDMNNDGLLDLMTAAYYDCRYLHLYLQNENGEFVNVTREAGLERLHMDDDACWVDYDGDGAMDLVTSVDGKLRIYKNNLSQDNNWLSVRLKSRSGNIEGVGVKVRVKTRKHEYFGEMGLVQGKLYHGPNQLHFGLGKEEALVIEVVWASGASEVFKSIETNTLITLEEGKGELRK